MTLYNGFLNRIVVCVCGRCAGLAAQFKAAARHKISNPGQRKSELPQTAYSLNPSYKEHSVDYLVWAIPATLWLLISLNTATWQKPLLLLEHTHQR